jgi:hypothetical protein
LLVSTPSWAWCSPASFARRLTASTPSPKRAALAQLESGDFFGKLVLHVSDD